MSTGTHHLYIVRDFDEPRDPAVLVWYGNQPEPTPRDEGLFVTVEYDPFLGAMVHPVAPDEWEYFALYQSKEAAGYYMHIGLEAARVALYLGFPANE